MSENGDTPVAYLGYHESDVVRAKVLSRLELLSEGEDPFLLFISPTSPHYDDNTFSSVPCARHMDLFEDAAVPRTPSFNPEDDIQKNKVSWVGQLPRMSAQNESWSDLQYKLRAQALVGIDEMMADILEFLENKGMMDNTYGKSTCIYLTALAYSTPSNAMSLPTQ